MKKEYTVIVTEKPDASRRIAEALAESKSLKEHVVNEEKWKD